jgi:hypothetical protein
LEATNSSFPSSGCLDLAELPVKQVGSDAGR